MKKLILLTLLAVIMTGCINVETENPSSYKGSIVTGKDRTLGVFALQLRLSDIQKDSIGIEYKWIEVTQLDYINYNLGDTIK